MSLSLAVTLSSLAPLRLRLRPLPVEGVIPFVWAMLPIKAVFKEGSR